MDAKLNKRERRAAALLAHYATCERLALALGMTAECPKCGLRSNNTTCPKCVVPMHGGPDGKKISVTLWKIERFAHEAATDYCNGVISAEQWEARKAFDTANVEKLFGKLPPGFFVNGDARGYALKIDNENASGREFFSPQPRSNARQLNGSGRCFRAGY
jgi:hypothetical protein